MAASSPLAKSDFAGFQPHPGRLSLRLFRHEVLSYRNALAPHSTDAKLSMIAARAGEASWPHFAQFAMPQRREAALSLRNVSRSSQVPWLLCSPLPMHELTILIDLQCGPRDAEEQPMLDDAWDGFYGGSELGRIGDRSRRAVHDEAASVRDPGLG